MIDASENCARIFRVLGEPERLRIVALLREGPKNVTKLSELLNSAIVNVSHHLKVMRDANLVEGRKKGRCVTYRLHPDVSDLSAKSADLNLELGCCRIAFPPLQDGDPSK